MDQDQIVERVLCLLRLESFANWYQNGGNFDQWLKGNDNAPNVDQIKQEIKDSIFNDRSKSS